ncbi:MAG: hypothetical protein ACR2PX_00930 [Endozoicomonas sp.]|uniref:hypothetical protein n=1 Tax=Endozoicomonas sp. TaxID=1892382 RepID=UPI003D9B26ED
MIWDELIVVLEAEIKGQTTLLEALKSPCSGMEDYIHRAYLALNNVSKVSGHLKETNYRSETDALLSAKYVTKILDSPTDNVPKPIKEVVTSKRESNKMQSSKWY